MVKKRASFSVDQTLLKKWNSYCEEKCINKSQLVEKIIKEFLQKEEKLNDSKKRGD